MDKIEQVKRQLERISVRNVVGIQIVNEDKSTIWFKGKRFNRDIEFNVAKTPTGKIKKNSVWVDEPYDNHLVYCG